MSIDVGYLPPAAEQYAGESSFFDGEPPLSTGVGYLVVLGFGAAFSIFTTVVVYLNQYFGVTGAATSEHFNTAGRMVKTGLIASVIISQWTWAAAILNSSNIAWQYGVAGPFWYASGASIQILLFGVLAIRIKRVAPSAHTAAEIVKARWGTNAHLTFLFFFFAANIIVTSMLLLGGAATVEALTGMDYRLASFLIPWGIILYTAAGGLLSVYISNYAHTVVIYGVLITMICCVYIKTYSSDQIYEWLQNTASKTPEQCQAIYSSVDGTTFYEPGKYACGPLSGNKDGSYLTMLSSDGLMFGIINIVGNFGTVFVDQSYWQSAIAARPDAAAKGYYLAGICWFAIPFSLATSLGLASTALMLPITSQEAGSGLVAPAVASHLMGESGALLILVMLFMAITSTGAAESIAFSSLVAYDVYREYINPEATGEQIVFVSRFVIIAFGLFSGVFAIGLNLIGLNLGWVYAVMGIVIGPAVVPLWNLMTWSKASGPGAIYAAWGGLILALIGWIVSASVQSGTITVDSLGTNEAMLVGNLIAILASGLIHYVYSIFSPQDFDFADLDGNILLVENDMRGLSVTEKDPILLEKSEQWIVRRGYVMSLILVVGWPVLSIPAGVFSKSYFAFWVLLAMFWGIGAGIYTTVLPLTESADEINEVFTGMYNFMTGTKPTAEGVLEESSPAAAATPEERKSVIHVVKTQDELDLEDDM